MTTTFEQLQHDVQACSSELDRLRQRKAQLHHQVKAEVIHVLERYEALYGDFDEGPLAHNELTMPQDRHILDYWHQDGDDLVFEFSYGFRGEVCNYEVALPARYLGAQGEACMQADAEALRQQQEREEAERSAAQDRHDRSLYESLKARFATDEGAAS